jgi:hypothetical protein
MTSHEKMGLAALCAAVAIVSSAVVSLFLFDGQRGPSPASAAVHERHRPTPARAEPILQTSALPDPIVPPAPDREWPALRAGDWTDADVVESTADPDRFAFVPRHAVTPLLSPFAAALIESETEDTWAAQTSVAPSAPQSVVRLPAAPPDQRLPWQTREPPLPQRSYTLSQRLAEIAPGAQTRLARKFEAAKAPWRPAEIALVAVKDEKTLELFARPVGGSWTFIHRYPVLAASGGSGPKLRRGDKQVPEGIYRISFLNPNSRFHVALRVDYPNAFDKRMGARDGRKDLGGDIMIHGKAASIGCLAIGDEAAEELFVLAAETGIQKIKLIIAPTDFRQKAVPPPQPGQPAWLPGLYTEVAAAMAEFKAPPSGGLLSLFSN